MQFTLYVDRLVNPGEEPLEGVRITLQDGVISSVEDQTISCRGDVSISSGVCSPALFNAHDHMKYTWPERVGRNGYQNSYEWLPTLYREAETRFLNAVSLEDLYWLGSYKSIFSGVTTVANHCRPLPHSFFSQFPVRILHTFRREIFARDDPRAHQMGLGAAEEARIAKRDRLPFVVHIGEGKDARTAEEIDLLDRLGGLFEGSVLIHAININERQIRRIAACRCSVVWCPVSNGYLFDRTAPIGALIRAGVNVALGTDSTCSGGQDLLDEMRFAHDEFASCSEDSARLLHSFCTVNGARAFGLHKLGRVAPGYTADLLVFESFANDPFRDLLTITPARIMLVLRDGRFLLRRRTLEIPTECVIADRSLVEIEDLQFEIAGNPERILARVARSSDQPRDAFPLGSIINATARPVFM